MVTGSSTRISWYLSPLFWRLHSLDFDTARFSPDIPLSCELALFERCHERRRKPVRAQVETALRASANIVNERDRPLVRLALVVELVLDGVQVDEVAHAGACVPAHIVRVHVDLAQELDHLVAIGDVLFGAGSSGGKAGSRVVLAVFGGHMSDLGERERICDFEDAVLLHADDAARGEGWERFAACGSNLDCDLKAIVSLLYVSSNPERIVKRPQIAGCRGVAAGGSHVPGRQSAPS